MLSRSTRSLLRSVASATAAPATIRASNLLFTSTISVSAPAPAQMRTLATLPAAVPKVKASTRLTGLDVVPNGRDVLIGLYKETLKVIQQMTQEHGLNEPNRYNKYIKQLCDYRLSVAEKYEDADDIEYHLNSGQIEELITQAENELDLLFYMNDEGRHLWDDTPKQPFSDRLPNGPFRFGWDPANTNQIQPVDEKVWEAMDAEIKADQQRDAQAKNNQ